MSSVWAPTSDRLVFISYRDGQTELYGIDIQTGREQVIVAQGVLQGDFDFSPQFRNNSIAYSPDGQSLAFLASKPVTPQPARPLHAIEAGEDWTPAQGEGAAQLDPVARLFVLDLATQKLRAVTDESLDVRAFQWSPDSRRFALEAAADPADPTRPQRSMRSDIYVVDAAGGAPRAVVSLPGQDLRPSWSPDGGHIAFCTQRGQIDWMYTCSLALAAADGHTAVRDIGQELDRLSGSGLSGLHWTPDGAAIDVRTDHHLSKQVFRVQVADGKTTRLTPRQDRCYGRPAYSRDGKLMALAVEGMATAPEVFVSRAAAFKPQQLTNLNPRLQSVSVPTVEIVRWRSPDERWDIHALLLKPSNYSSNQRYPMLTRIMGGPGMVSQGFNEAPLKNYPLLALAEQGYVILIPNSRGREGFGMDFTHAIRDERSYVLNPLGDVLRGVDEMVARGIADADKLGILGFSYGGTLTSYAITQTDRFKAAIYGEGSPNLLDGFFGYANTEILGLSKDMWGFKSPYEPGELERALEQTAIIRLDRVRTPVMVESGEISAWKRDRAYFRGLKYFGIPAEFWVYPRSGHGWDEPLLLQDAYRRHLAWFDYWIKDKPYPDAQKQQAYDTWKNRRVSTAAQ